ncbi:CehA/McbA family metallohydrolase [Novosphingobium sp. BL-8A]|uniref:CehA/McbA family metallohydrolase n=1 Tax=Novosphingobium sp. BL-8A TaxID=3127639 RepID=UPI0037570B2A
MIVRTLVRCALPLLLTMGTAVPATAAADDAPARVDTAVRPFATLTGTMTRADHEHYREIPFILPAGVTRLTIRFSYEGREQKAAIDMGLVDPQRLRGWSGGARSGMTLSETDATPGYLPGLLPAGKWHLLLGVPNLRVDGHAPWKAEIFVERGAIVTSFADAPLNDKAGWYRGDLHMHTGNSDGKCSAQSGRKVPCPVYRTLEAAAARGLDFIAVTDHNTTAQSNALRELQPAFDRLLLVPGREITTFYGHANVFGITAPLDWRMDAPTWAQARKWMEAANRAGGIVSLNHAGSPSGENCMGCGWRVPDLPAGTVGAVEVINGGTMAETGRPDSPNQGIGLWDRLLAAGKHVTGIGGSDNHDAPTADKLPNPVGTPTTVVYMKELSVPGFLAGIRAGRVFIDIDGTGGRMLDLVASAQGRAIHMGETLEVPKGDEVTLDPQVRGVEQGTVALLVDGVAVSALTRATDGVSGSVMWRSDGERHSIRAEVRDKAGKLILLGNPVYIAPAR